MKKYQIIYADPPWEYKASRSIAETSCLSGENYKHYNYMSIEDLCSLPIWKITDNNCLLFLWITGPKLNIAFNVGISWGFEYATIAFVWDKQRLNPGYYTMSQVELCLVFRKGNIPTPRGKRNIRQLLSEERRGHSKKPDTIRKKIVEMFPTQNKIELFARKPENVLFEDESWKGWDVWGNEVESDINLEENE